MGKGEDWGYTNWKEGQPDEGSSEACVFIQKDHDGVWKDGDCTKDDVHGYICMLGTTTSVDSGKRKKRSSFNGKDCYHNNQI